MMHLFFNRSLTTGFYIGIVASVILLTTNFAPSQLSQMVCYMVFSLGVYIGQRKYNAEIIKIEKQEQKVVSTNKYWHYVWYGTVAGIGASIIISLFMVLYIKFNNPEFGAETIELSQKYIEKWNIYSDIELEQIKSMMHKIFIPSLIVSNIISYTFLSFMFSLVGAWLTKKYNNTFNNNNN